MKTFAPTMPQDHGGPNKCPLYNTEWFTCNVTDSKCPKEWDDDSTPTGYMFDFPDDCPAKEGVEIKN